MPRLREDLTITELAAMVAFQTEDDEGWRCVVTPEDVGGGGGALAVEGMGVYVWVTPEDGPFALGAGRHSLAGRFLVCIYREHGDGTPLDERTVRYSGIGAAVVELLSLYV